MASLYLDGANPPFTGANDLSSGVPATTETFDVSYFFFYPANSVSASLNGGALVGTANQLTYATTHFSGVAASTTLQPELTITFTRPIYSFGVTVNDLTSFLLDFSDKGSDTPITYEVRDDVGDVEDIVLNELTSESGTVVFNTGGIAFSGAKQITIQPLTKPSGQWCFSIDNITFDNDTTQINTLKSIPSQGFDAAAKLYILFSVYALATQGAAAKAFLELQVAGLAATVFGLEATEDPFDTNYAQGYTPVFHQLPTVQADSTLSQQAANDTNTALSDFSHAIGYLQALLVTANRFNSAEQAGDQASVALQNSLLDSFMSLSSSSLLAAGTDLATLADDVNDATVTTQNITNFINNVKLHGFAGLPQQEQDLLNSIGLSSADQQTMINEIVSTNASDVPTSLFNALEHAATSLAGFANAYASPSPAQDIEGSHVLIIRTALAIDQAVAIADAIKAGTQTEAQYVNGLITQAEGSTVPALATYDFFFGDIPASAGLDYLTNFAATIQTPTGGGFSLINTFVNLAATFSINASSTFAATFGVASGTSEQTFFNNVYNQLFGHAPSQAAVDNYFHTQTHL